MGLLASFHKVSWLALYKEVPRLTSYPVPEEVCSHKVPCLTLHDSLLLACFVPRSTLIFWQCAGYFQRVTEKHKVAYIWEKNLKETPSDVQKCVKECMFNKLGLSCAKLSTA